MRFVRFASTIAGFGLMVLSLPAMHAQGTVSIVSGGGVGVSGVAGGISYALGGQGMTGMPYTATRKTTRVQKLADGTTITTENTTKEARDSNGRTYHENQIKPFGGAGQAEFSVINVIDPVSRIQMNWTTNQKEVTVFHMREPGQIKQVQQTAAVTQPQPPAIKVVQTKPEMEDLGIKTIAGLEAKGTRVTRVIPAGREGNDRPLTITSENWFSPDLRIMVMSTNDDPRSGATTMELTDIDRGEPDPTLFQVPEGFTVKEQFPGQQN